MLVAVLSGCPPRGQGETTDGAGGGVAIENTLWLKEMNSGDDKRWKDVTSQIEKAGMDARAFLLDALRFNDGGVRSARIREYAALRLGQLKAPECTIELAAALKDPDMFVSSEAATALKAIKDPLVVPLIIEMLEADPRPSSDAERAMFEVLKDITCQVTGIDYRLDEKARAETIARCKAWWEQYSSSHRL